MEERDGGVGQNHTHLLRLLMVVVSFTGPLVETNEPWGHSDKGGEKDRSVT